MESMEFLNFYWMGLRLTLKCTENLRPASWSHKNNNKNIAQKLAEENIGEPGYIKYPGDFVKQWLNITNQLKKCTNQEKKSETAQSRLD